MNEQCIFPNCPKPLSVKKNGLCLGHNSQRLRGEELRPLRKHRDIKPGQPVICNGCNEYKGWDEFYKSSNGEKSMPRSLCIECHIKVVKENFERKNNGN